MKRKHVVILIVIAILFGISLVPCETTQVPEWKVKITSDSGKEIIGLDIAQSCRNYTLDVTPCLHVPDSVLTTNERGQVTFPKRTITMSLLERGWRTIKNLVLYFAHGSLGSDIYLQTSTSL